MATQSPRWHASLTERLANVAAALNARFYTASEAAAVSSGPAELASQANDSGIVVLMPSGAAGWPYLVFLAPGEVVNDKSSNDQCPKTAQLGSSLTNLLVACGVSAKWSGRVNHGIVLVNESISLTNFVPGGGTIH